MGVKTAFRNTIWMLLGCLGALGAADPQIHHFDSGANTDLGLIWLSVKVSDNDGDLLRIDQAEVAFAESGNTSPLPFQSILNSELGFLTLTASTTPTTYHLTWDIPEALLKQDEASLAFNFRVTDGTNSSKLHALTLPKVDIKSDRERTWVRPITNGIPYVYTINPGNFAMIDFEGGGMIARMAEDIQMGKVRVDVQGGIEASSVIDNFPENEIPEGINLTTPSLSYFRPKKLFESEFNATQNVKITLLEEKNPRSLDHWLALTTFSLIRHSSEGKSINSQQFDFEVDDSSLKLFSVPKPFSSQTVSQVIGVVPSLKHRGKAAVAQQAGWKIKWGLYPEALRLEKLLNTEQLETEDWEWDEPYLLKIQSLSRLGLESVHQLNPILFKSKSSVMPWKEENQPFEAWQGQVKLIVKNWPGGVEPEIQYQALVNEDRFEEWPTSSEILIVQNAEWLEGFSFEIESQQKVVLQSYHPKEGIWKEHQLEKGESTTLTEAGPIVLMDPEQLKSLEDQNQSGSGGGGCFLR